MKIAFFLLFIVPFWSIAQTDSIVPLSNDGYYYDFYDCKSLYSNAEVKIILKNEPVTHCGQLGLSLFKDKYWITIFWVELTESGAIIHQSKEYNGAYHYNAEGDVILTGDHPFTQNKLSVKHSFTTIDHGKYETGRTIKYKFKKEFRWINRGKKLARMMR